MAFKQFDLTGQPVKIYKRRNSRSVRLSIGHNGEVRVSIPLWAPYAAGLSFAKSKLDWILQQRTEAAGLLVNGQQIGKSHRLYLQPSGGSKVTSRVIRTEIIVRYPASYAPGDTAVQTVAKAACVRALRVQAERLLPQRLAELAAQYGYNYTSVGIKQLKSRWGSCDQQQHIVLNLFLMQLPWQLIDYVLLHELAHTRVMRHGAPFWLEMQQHLPNAKQLRTAMREYQPVLLSNALTSVA